MTFSGADALLEMEIEIGLQEVSYHKKPTERNCHICHCREAKVKLGAYNGGWMPF